ncbi:MAG: nicotinate (nicotinamide) nucleotide adenylyltransferase [Candidatus Margulisbacteria bacterium]|nr:nicotinate (nicotinamide) nucleotide adenylyltransferase [Candidatus Margulisiibacteriota bacterium]
MKKIIFGGSFDPVHNAHLHIARHALKHSDRVVFVPCYENPLSKSIKATAEQRLAMLKLATADNHRFEVSDYELKKQGISYSIETVKHFMKEGFTDLGLLIGYDVILDLKHWHKIEELLELVTFYVFNRPDFPKEVIYKEINSTFLKKAKIVEIEQKGMNISSTMVKIYRYMNEDISLFIPSKVSEFIDNNQIYLKQKTFSDIPDDTLLCNPQLNGRIILQKNKQ